MAGYVIVGRDTTLPLSSHFAACAHKPTTNLHPLSPPKLSIFSLSQLYQPPHNRPPWVRHRSPPPSVPTLTLPATQDYYKVLSVDTNASQQQIRDAYKKAALKHHPDRVPSDSPERAARTKRFQAINDAYYTLSDPARRRDYDAARTYNNWTGSTATPDAEWDDEVPAPGEQQGAGSTFGGFPWSAFGFGAKPAGSTEESHNKFSEEQFGGIFEEMLREEGMADQDAGPTGKFWSVVGGLSGGAMGFIVANFTGMVAGAVAGNRLGSVRDAKGKSVYAVFQEMPQADKARLLSSLAAKVLSSAVSG